QRQVWLNFNPATDHLLQVGNTRSAVTSHGKTAAKPLIKPPVLHWVHPHATDLKPLRDCTGPVASLQGTQHPISQVLRIRPHGCYLLSGKCGVAIIVNT